MNGIFWNYRGAGKSGMTTCFSDLIKEHSLDFLCLQETMKKKFPSSFFRKIDPYNTFDWNWIPSASKSGGLFCGVKKEKLEVVSWSLGKYILQVTVFYVEKQCVWALLNVYGAAHDEHKYEFLEELASFCSHLSMPYIVGGDFNILRHCGEKNKKMVTSHYIDGFNPIINTMCLREIYVEGVCLHGLTIKLIPR